MNNIPKLQKNINYEIQEKTIENKDIKIVKKQNIRIYILYVFIIILIFIVLKEYVYDLVVIRRAGLNSTTLNENIIDKYSLHDFDYIYTSKL